MREFIFCRYFPPIVFYPQIWMTKMNSKIEGNTLGILRRSFFPFNALGMPSFNNSVLFVTAGLRGLLLNFTYYSFLTNWCRADLTNGLMRCWIPKQTSKSSSKASNTSCRFLSIPFFEVERRIEKIIVSSSLSVGK